MKITARDYEKLKQVLDRTIERLGVSRIKDHRSLRLGKDINRRFAWDLLNASNIVIGDGKGINGDINLYAYMNDDHITTAVLKYVKDREDLDI